MWHGKITVSTLSLALGLLAAPIAALADISPDQRVVLVPGPSGILAPGRTAAYTVDYSHPPYDSISTGQVAPVLISARFDPSPSLPNTVGFQIIEPLGKVTQSEIANKGTGTPDVNNNPDPSNIRNAYLAPRLQYNGSPVTGTCRIVLFNQSHNSVSYSLESTILPITGATKATQQAAAAPAGTRSDTTTPTTGNALVVVPDVGSAPVLADDRR